MKNYLLMLCLGVSLGACNSGGDASDVGGGAVSPLGVTVGDSHAWQAGEISASHWPARAGESVQFRVAGAPVGSRFEWRIDGAARAGAGEVLQATLQLEDDSAEVSVDIVAPDSSRQTRRMKLDVVFPVGIGLLAGSVTESGNLNGEALQARFNWPQAVVANSRGVVFVSDAGTVRKIERGSVSLVAGKFRDYRVVDGIAADARFGSTAVSLAIDDDGLLAADRTVLRRIAADGSVSTLAGQAGVYAESVDGARDSARMTDVMGACRSNGRLLLSDSSSVPLLRTVDASGAVATVLSNWQRVSGGGASQVREVRYRPLDGVSISLNTNTHVDAFEWIDSTAQLALACSAAGEQYLVDSPNNWIRKVGADGSSVVYAGQQVSLGNISGMAMGLDGYLYVADGNQKRIMRVSPNGSVSILAADPSSNPSSVAPIIGPLGAVRSLAVDRTGKIVYFLSGSAVMYLSLP